MKIITLEKSQWLGWRQNGLGASEAGAIMGVCKFKTALEVWALKTENLLPEKSTYRMRRGRILEPLARSEYSKMTGIPMVPIYAEHDEFSFIHASIDGRNRTEKRPLEIKCSGAEDHAIAKSGKIPEHYKYQLVQTLLVTGDSEMDYFSFDGTKGVIVPFKRDIRLENRLLPELKKFWRLVQTNTPPNEPNVIPLRSAR